MEGTILNNNNDHLALIISMCLGVHNVISSSYPKLINRSDYYPFTELSNKVMVDVQGHSLSVITSLKT